MTVSLNLDPAAIPTWTTYAVTSHSSQGQTADRVFVHIDLRGARENRQLAYVAVSRGRYDAQIYTNDQTQLAAALDHDVSHRAPIEPTSAPVSTAQTIQPSPERQPSIAVGI